MKTRILLLLSGSLLTLLTAACGFSPPQAGPSSTDRPAETATVILRATSTPETSVPTSTPTPIPPSSTPIPATGTATAIPRAASFPDPDGYGWQPVVSGLTRPLGLTHAGDGSGRLFILEQPGTIRIVQDGTLVSEPFLDIRERVGDTANEQGLLGIAFHPRYVENGYFYTNYTDNSGDTVIARFQVSEDRNRADPASEVRLLSVSQPFRNHNGGGLAFGPDGYLYIGLGDGGSAGDPQGNGQSLSTLLGKILRLDVDTGDPYRVPPDNPFADGGGLPEIWAYGLRNPWRFAFDRLTGELYIGDVGQNLWEEIDFLPAETPGVANFGWNYRESSHPFRGTPPSDLVLVDPIAEYGHEQGCSVTGGEVYRGASMPEWQGIYLYGDFCSGLVWGLLRAPEGTWIGMQLFSTGASITSFGADGAGEIYLLDRRGGVFRLARE